MTPLNLQQKFRDFKFCQRFPSKYPHRASCQWTVRVSRLSLSLKLMKFPGLDRPSRHCIWKIQHPVVACVQKTRLPVPRPNWKIQQGEVIWQGSSSYLILSNIQHILRLLTVHFSRFGFVARISRITSNPKRSTWPSNLFQTVKSTLKDSRPF